MCRKTVLIAEDDSDHRDILCIFLRHHGYEVLEAVSGADAVRVAVEHHPALILMDVGLPGLNGWEAMQRLKEEPATAAIPVVVLTAFALDSARLRSEQLGCYSFVAKPCTPHEVLAEVQHWAGTP